MDSTAKAIEHLAGYAREGQIEAAYVFDRETAEQLAFVEGGPDEVTLDRAQLRGHSNVVALHSHRQEAPTGPEDWKTFLEEALREILVVTPRYCYRLEKPEGWKPPSARRGSGLTVDVYFLAHANRLKASRGFRARRWHSIQDALEAILYETNQQMAERYGVSFQREELP